MLGQGVKVSSLVAEVEFGVREFPTEDAEKVRLLYVVTEDWYFLSHRLPMARAARDAGFEVHVATRVTDGAAAIAAEGFSLHPRPVRARSAVAAGALATILRAAAGPSRASSRRHRPPRRRCSRPCSARSPRSGVRSRASMR